MIYNVIILAEKITIQMLQVLQKFTNIIRKIMTNF